VAGIGAVGDVAKLPPVGDDAALAGGDLDTGQGAVPFLGQHAPGQGALEFMHLTDEPLALDDLAGEQRYGLVTEVGHINHHARGQLRILADEMEKKDIEPAVDARETVGAALVAQLLSPAIIGQHGAGAVKHAVAGEALGEVADHGPAGRGVLGGAPLEESPLAAVARHLGREGHQFAGLRCGPRK